MIESEENKAIREEFRVCDSSFSLANCQTNWKGTERMKDAEREGLKKGIKKYLKANLQSLQTAQELLWASNKRSLLIVFQAMDAAGKDSTIAHVMSGVNPQGVNVHSFKAPSSHELDHDWLWRYTQLMPERGKIEIFNRSYYEEVLVVKVHPEILESRPLPNKNFDEAFWNTRYQTIRDMESHLNHSGTTIIKFFLHVSAEEQKRRLLDRLNETDKLWKFSENDVHERKYWHQYMQAYDEAIKATATKDSPWYVIPADDKWKMRALVSMIITHTISKMDISFPVVSDNERLHLDKVKQQLELSKV